MPVACAPAAGGDAGPASTATSTATSRRIVVSFPRFGVSVRQVPSRTAIVPPPATRRGPPTEWTGRARVTGSEADAARQDERLAATKFPASLCERGEVRALHLERGPAEHVQSRLSVRGAHARHRD